MTAPNTGNTGNGGNGGAPVGSVAPAAITTTATPAPTPAAVAPAPQFTTAPTASPSQAGHNPNVIVPRSQMTKGQQRALDRHNAAEIQKRDATVAEYLRSVLPSDEEPVEASPSGEQPVAETAATPEPSELEQVLAKEREAFDQQFGVSRGERAKGETGGEGTKGGAA
jgi:hypothetical protein